MPASINIHNSLRSFGSKPIPKIRNHAPLFALENAWIIFAIFLISSFYWWGRVPIGPLNVPIVAFIVPAIAALWIFSLPFRMHQKEDNLLIVKKVAPLLIMIVGMGFSLFSSEDLDTSLPVFFEMLFYVFMFFLISKTIRTESGIKKITISLILAISFIAFDGLYRFFIAKTLWRLGAGDVLTATNMGAFMLQASILLISSKIIFDREQLNASKMFYLLILCFMGVAILFTYSRGAWVTSIIGLAIFVKHCKKLILPIILIPIIIIFFFPDAISNRAASIFNFGNQNKIELYRDIQVKNSNNLRLNNMETSLNTILENPILGQGIGSHHGEYSPGQDKGESAPHNAYLRIWSEGGALAIIGFLWFVISLAISLFRAIKETKEQWKWIQIGYLAVFLTHIVYMFLGDWPFQIYFWVFAGLATASLKILNPRLLNI